MRSKRDLVTNIELRVGRGILAAALLVAAACSSSGTATDAGRDAGRDSVSTGAGGAAGSGGAGGTGTGGASGEDAGNDVGIPGCAAAPYTHVSSFGASFDGWAVPPNNPTPNLAPMPGVDGGPPTGTIQTLDTTDGSPASPSVKLAVPFSGFGEQLLFAQNYLTPLNLRGATITAQIKLDSGGLGDPTAVLRAFLVLKTTSIYNYAPGVAVNLEPGTGWVTLILNADAPNPAPPIDYNPCDVREIDIQIDTGSSGTYTAAVIHIDQIAITGPGGSGDGGADATAGQ